MSTATPSAVVASTWRLFRAIGRLALTAGSRRSPLCRSRRAPPGRSGPVPSAPHRLLTVLLRCATSLQQYLRDIHSLTLAVGVQYSRKAGQLARRARGGTVVERWPRPAELSVAIRRWAKEELRWNTPLAIRRCRSRGRAAPRRP